MSSGVRFTTIPEPSELGEIWKDLEELIGSLKSRLERRAEEYSELAIDVVNRLESGIQGAERQAQLCKLRESWAHIQTLERELRFYLKQLRRLAESSISRIAEQLGTLSVDSMARAIQASEMSKACYEKPVEPLFDTVTESPLESTSESWKCQESEEFKG
ncbi:Uncharacterized protein LW94_8770 [Fusarium fujikuroi]|uniref:Uncharacterized protein n=1 Tax=Fusarium fujikuroi TaxID=5127 RepID=A0A9Q9S0V5_FUSFU|nr:Uncharacterized protein LW94_8770 [Fusarium fujikuroi]SCN92597.1 uncharacterized protein FFE2_07415 [Fusarium fujikuroi]SCO42832.1 uncharacterized protein FFMR_06992 [Fusarium fujikuroi]SCV32199.1 uncharacterized protein FFFS_03173 [Fusarium fujikuroi]VTT82836.1 unnamed protein product [Fusarium fujikuroi]